MRFRPIRPRLSAAGLVVLVGLLSAFGGVQAGHGVPHAPTITSVTPGDSSLTVAWTEPTETGNSAITAYDVRTIESAAGDKADAEWEVVEEAWISGDLNFAVTGLSVDVQYDVQVRAVNADGDGDWSTTTSGTPEDHGDSRESATALTLETPAGGVIDSGTDADYFSVSLSRAAGLFVYTSGDLDTVGELQSSGGEVIHVNNDGYLPHGAAHFFLWASVEPGQFFIKVTGHRGATGAYTIHTKQIVDSTGIDDAQPVALDGFANGIIEPGTDADYFKLDLASDTDLVIRTTGSILDTGGRILDSTGAVIASNEIGFLSHLLHFAFRLRLEAGEYYIKVLGGISESTGPYTLHVDSVNEPGNTTNAATDVMLGEADGGRIDPSHDVDYFRLTLARDTYVRIFGVSLVVDIEGLVLDSNTNPVDV